jgi:hypothetical protein
MLYSATWPSSYSKTARRVSIPQAGKLVQQSSTKSVDKCVDDIQAFKAKSQGIKRLQVLPTN